MKYTTVFFDWGDTLACHDSKGNLLANKWIEEMIPHLYHNCYRLGIISNTHRYQDAYHIRSSLERKKLLAYFEMIISSAIYAVHKPDVEIFQKAYEFMQVNPKHVVMVGDSEHCDGGCQFFGSTYLKVEPKERWDGKLYELLEESLPSGRLLTNLYEYNLKEGEVVTKLRHLSEPLKVGSRLLLNHREYIVTEVGNYADVTKEQIIKAKNEWIRFKVVPS